MTEKPSGSGGVVDRSVPRTARGFTLVEMLVALAIFALASTLAYGGLNAITRARSQLEAENARLGRVQFAIGLIERDLRSAARRGVRDGYGAPHAPVEGTAARLELSRQGYANALAQPRAEIERVIYRREGEVLQRQRFGVLDRAPGSAPQIDALLDRVQDLDWRYVSADGREVAQWPPPNADTDAAPRAVIFRLILADYGELRRVLELPDGDAP